MFLHLFCNLGRLHAQTADQRKLTKGLMYRLSVYSCTPCTLWKTETCVLICIDGANHEDVVMFLTTPSLAMVGFQLFAARAKPPFAYVVVVVVFYHIFSILIRFRLFEAHAKPPFA